ncbi:damage-inducible protein CinA [Vibrio cidicii]|uniref:Damage-inducible protein CinA n=1 Tax=Vibrio cidicii TaxID=1763883 RepID=A0A151KWC4_9VIBR|nr:nicotinamide-nucleotide amidase [Vibrio cidicii]EJN6827543.1 nicotinamide-nucleotide amidase [Vibrio cidicii]ELV8623686.1 nicotinamide-nucleotide amidase [Vibrio cidicii]KYN87407.1 damage-inducible protein CinA [Vibrio cidicii]
MDAITTLSGQLGEQLKQHKQILATAESCTGGGVASAITDIAGSSGWFDRAFVTYSNDAKMEMLGVSAETLEQHGAVSEEVVEEMARGALNHSRATIAIAISGIAGPDGGTELKPVGTVCFAWLDKNGWQSKETCLFPGDRAAIRQAAVLHALQVVSDSLVTK